MPVQIRSRFDSSKILRTVKADTLVEADLRGADLRGADLSGAYLRWADLRGADLREADLSEADLREAYLRGAYLRWADLRGADLSEADLREAYLSVADLSGIRVNWRSHDLIAELLCREAGEDAERRAFAGLILVSRDWCWEEFLGLGHSQTEWAASVLRPFIHPEDSLPGEMRAWLEAHPEPAPQPNP